MGVNYSSFSNNKILNALNDSPSKYRSGHEIYNCTAEEESRDEIASWFLLTVILIFRLFSLIFLGRIVVFIKKSRRINNYLSTANTLFINLLICDLLTTILDPIQEATTRIIYDDDWVLGLYSCKVFRTIISISSIVSNLTLAAITVNNIIKFYNMNKIIYSAKKPKFNYLMILLCASFWVLGYILIVCFPDNVYIVQANDCGKHKCLELWDSSDAKYWYTLTVGVFFEAILLGSIASGCHFLSFLKLHSLLKEKREYLKCFESERESLELINLNKFKKQNNLARIHLGPNIKHQLVKNLSKINPRIYTLHEKKLNESISNLERARNLVVVSCLLALFSRYIPTIYNNLLWLDFYESNFGIHLVFFILNLVNSLYSPIAFLCQNSQFRRKVFKCR